MRAASELRRARGRGFLELNQHLILPLSCHAEGHVHLGEQGRKSPPWGAASRSIREVLWELRGVCDIFSLCDEVPLSVCVRRYTASLI